MTPWGAEGQFHDALNCIDQAIRNSSLLSFEYYDLYNRKTNRTAEPYTILLKSGAWYLYAFCLLRQDYRLFRISRMFDLDCGHTKFAPREGAADPSLLGKLDRKRKEEKIIIRFKEEARGRIPDFFDPREAIEDENDSLRFEMSFPIDEWLISIFLGLGDGAEVLEPESLRMEIGERIKKMASVYKL